MFRIRQTDILRIGPVPVQAEAQADRDVDGGDGALRDRQGVEDQKVAAMLLQPVADLDDPTVALGGIRAARYKTGFL